MDIGVTPDVTWVVCGCLELFPLEEDLLTPAPRRQEWTNVRLEIYSSAPACGCETMVTAGDASKEIVEGRRCTSISRPPISQQRIYIRIPTWRHILEPLYGSDHLES